MIPDAQEDRSYDGNMEEKDPFVGKGLSLLIRTLFPVTIGQCTSKLIT